MMKKNVLNMAVLGALFSAASMAYALEDKTTALPDAQPGECYARVVIPAQYRTESSTVVVKEASEKLQIIPAKYETVEERVMVGEAGSELRAIPATYATETQTYEVEPASSRWVMNKTNSNVNANPAMLAMVRASGLNLDSARPGQCFDEHYKPASYKTVTERVQVSEASEKIQLIPAKYEWVEQRVMVSPASRKLVEVPAVFDTVSERVLVEDAKTVWKKGRGSVEKIDHASGDIMCLVEVPAVYKTINKSVLKSAPSTRVVEEPARYETIRVRKLVAEASEKRVVIPAKYKEITKRVLDKDGVHTWHNSSENGAHHGKHTGNKICLQATPAKMASVERQVVKSAASVQRVEIPAKYETRKVRRLVSEAREIRTPVPAQTSNVTKRIKVSDARMEWRPVLCEINMTDGMVKKVQRALSSAGYAPGPFDGVLGAQTMNAVERFQKARGLATGGLTYDTLEKLGVDI